MRLPRLVDERDPLDTRVVIATLLGRSTAADIAVARLRLAGIELHGHEVPGGLRCRVVTTAIDADTLADAADAALDPRLARSLGALAALLDAQRAEVRVARGRLWHPDFSVFHGSDGAVALAGAHVFARPAAVSPALLAAFEGAEAARIATRFEELWADADDVTAVVGGALARALTNCGT